MNLNIDSFEVPGELYASATLIGPDGHRYLRTGGDSKEHAERRLIARAKQTYFELKELPASERLARIAELYAILDESFGDDW